METKLQYEPLDRVEADALAVIVFEEAGDFPLAKAWLDELKASGLEAFRRLVADSIPVLRARIGELASWDNVKLLTVRIDRLRTWHRPGLLCIGDAAHAMSPIGGVGINLAVQDAVAAANALSEPLVRHELIAPALLARIQKRRTFPTWATQQAQLILQKVILRALARPSSGALPLPFRLLNRFPRLRHLPARVVGLGLRPEHVLSPEHTPERAGGEPT